MNYTSDGSVAVMEPTNQKVVGRSNISNNLSGSLPIDTPELFIKHISAVLLGESYDRKNA